MKASYIFLYYHSNFSLAHLLLAIKQSKKHSYGKDYHITIHRPDMCLVLGQRTRTASY